MTERQYDYKVVTSWPKIPEPYYPCDVCGVVADRDENIYILNRGEHPFIELNNKGEFVKSWGKGAFGRAHGISISRDGHIWCVDDNNHAVMEYTKEGRLLQTLGTPGVWSDTGCKNKDYRTITRSAGPFCYPTSIAFSKQCDDIFIADGYGNARIHRFSGRGELINSFGSPGTAPGQFNIPHGIALSEDDIIYVADRENDRVQLFDTEGKLLDIWDDIVYRPQNIAIDVLGNVFVIELGYRLQNTIRKSVDVIPWSRVSIFTKEGKLIQRIGEPNGLQPGSLHAAHAIALSPNGNMYTGEVILTLCKGAFPEGAHSLQKFELVSAPKC